MKILNKILIFVIMFSFYHNLNSLFIPRNNIFIRNFKNLNNSNLNSKTNLDNNLIENFKTKTLNQKIFYESLNKENKKIFICTGPPGTGKSYISCLFALIKLEQKEINKIILTRPSICVDNEEHGYLPGDLNKKMYPYIAPIFDIIDEYKGYKTSEKMINKRILDIIPFAFMRGRTFKNSIIIADEMQNSSPNQMFMLLSRLGENSKLIINGDLEQTDILKENGLLNLIKNIEKYRKKNNDDLEYFEFIKLEKEDIIRSNVIKEVYNIYNKDNKNDYKNEGKNKEENNEINIENNIEIIDYINL